MVNDEHGERFHQETAKMEKLSGKVAHFHVG
jgi:hypothetical protein